MVTTVIRWTRQENVDVTTSRCPSASLLGCWALLFGKWLTDGSYP